MGEHYDHFALEERCTIARLREDGQSLRQIAAALDRSPSSVSRELKRNHGAQVGYRPAYAQEQASARRWQGSRLEREAELRKLVLGCLERGWSPEQVAGWLKQQKTATTISHESIYRFIYAQIRRTNDGAWRRYFRRAKFKRGGRGREGGPPPRRTQGGASITDPAKAAQPTVDQLLASPRPLDRQFRQTVTFDNGREFAQHYKLNDELGVQTF